MTRPHDNSSAKTWRKWERECQKEKKAASAANDWLAWHHWHTLEIEAYCIAGRKEAGLPLNELAQR